MKNSVPRALLVVVALGALAIGWFVISRLSVPIEPEVVHPDASKMSLEEIEKYKNRERETSP